MIVKVEHSNADEKVLKKGPNTIVCSAFCHSSTTVSTQIVQFVIFLRLSRTGLPFCFVPQSIGSQNCVLNCMYLVYYKKINALKLLDL